MTTPGAAGDDHWTIDRARRDVARRLREAGIDTPDLDARLIVGHALALDFTAMTLQAARAVGAADRAAIDAFAVRRIGREPVARILGMQEFWGLRFAVTPSVLVPRPDTETVVAAALAALDIFAAPRIADLGTGSGAILCALLHERPRAWGVATDRSHDALATARRNARELGFVARAAFVACDYGAALAGGFDLVVSNPPYVRKNDIAGLEPDVRDFDPPLALDGGIDGLDAYRVIAADAARLLAPGGSMVVELGAGQEAEVAALMASAGLQVAGPARRDLAGVPRALTARLPG